MHIYVNFGRPDSRSRCRKSRSIYIDVDSRYITRSSIKEMMCNSPVRLLRCNHLVQRCSIHHVNYSTNVTFDMLLKEENKSRTQKLLQRALPVRSTKEMPLHRSHSNAAVLVPLCYVEGVPSLLFTLRSTRLKQHKGQVSFPGGNVDASDQDFTHTALRETEEELGLGSERFNIWGQMNPMPGSQSGHKMVYPVVASLRDDHLDVNSLVLNPDEVEQAFTVPLSHLCNPANAGTTRFRAEKGKPFTLPVFLGGTHRIWGLTAIVTHQLLTVLAPGLYNFKVIHKKDVSHHHKAKLR